MRLPAVARSLGALLATIAFSWLPASEADSASRAAPQIENGGFEAWGVDGPVGWSRLRPDDPPLRRETRRSLVHAGRSALRLEGTAKAKNWVHLEQRIPVRPDARYRLHFRVRGKGRFGVYFFQYANQAFQTNAELPSLTLHDDEWTDAYADYVVRDEATTGIRPAFAISSPPGSWALIDEVRIETFPHREQPELLPNGSLENDVDGDGEPDGWVVSDATGSDPESSRGRTGGRALYYQQPRSPQPAPSWKDWWNPAVQKRSVPGIGFRKIVSPSFPVEPGRTYRVRFASRAEGFPGRLNVDLEWLDEFDKPIKRGIRNRERLLRSLKRTDTWDWETVSADTTTPIATVARARVVIHSNRGGGRLWLDQFSVRAVDVPTSAISGGLDRIAVERVGSRLEPETRVPARPIADVPWIEASGRNEVDSSRPGRIQVRLANGVELSLERRGNRILGVNRVASRGRALRNSTAPPIAPLIETRDRDPYTSCEYEGWKALPDGVVLRTRLVTKSGRRDALRWVFRERALELDGETYVGFSYHYEMDTDAPRIERMIDRATWELDGHPLGISLVDQDLYSHRNVRTMEPNHLALQRDGSRLSHNDLLDYQFGAEGGLALFHCDAISGVQALRRATPDWISYQDRIPFPTTNHARSPRKCVLLSQRGGIDEWTRIRDHALDLQSRAWRTGIAPDPVPMARLERRGIARLARAPDSKWWSVAAREDLPRIASAGFRGVVLDTVWGETAPRAPDNLTVSSVYGGAPALKAFVDRAHELGMVVIAWAPTAHLTKTSDLFARSPEIALLDRKNRPHNAGYGPLAGTRFEGGWSRYALSHFERARNSTGLDGLWLDSFHGFGAGDIGTLGKSTVIEQSSALMRYVAALSSILRVHTEATGTLAVPAATFSQSLANLDRSPPDRPDPSLRYKTTQWVETGDAARAAMHGDYYYRSLANKAALMLPWFAITESSDQTRRMIRAANADYHAVRRDMHHRTTLPEGHGVEWRNSAGDMYVLFAFAEFRRDVMTNETVFDVTSNADVDTSGGSFEAKKNHTYRIQRTHPTGPPAGDGRSEGASAS